MELKSANRWKAFGCHLLISASIALLSTMLVFLVWYAGPLATASGVKYIFLLLLFVDVCLGPIITLVVFNPKKKELKRDLAIVALIQLGALLYGLHTVFIARPAYMVFNVDRFDLVYANDLTKEKLQRAAKPEFQSLPWFGVKTIAAQSPQNAKEREELLFNALAGGADLPQRPEYYVEYTAERANAIRRAHPCEELKRFNKDRIPVVENLMAQYAEKKTDIKCLPLKGKVRDMTVILEQNTGNVLEIADLRPW